MKNCKKEHPYADILRAIADGEKIQRRINGGHLWLDEDINNVLGQVRTSTLSPDTYRIKPETVIINGHEVPKPLTHVPSNGEVVHYPDMCAEYMYHTFEWTGTAYHFKLLYRGLLHKNSESAIAHGKALLSFTEDLS